MHAHKYLIEVITRSNTVDENKYMDCYKLLDSWVQTLQINERSQVELEFDKKKKGTS